MMYYATGLAILASTALTVGLYFMKRQAERLPSLGSGWPSAAWWAFASDPLWVFGVVLQAAGYGIYLAALRDAPLSIVHTALNGGIVLFVLLAVWGLGERLQALEWLGIATVTGGLLALGCTLSSGAGGGGIEHGALPFSLATIAAAVLAARLDREPSRAIGLSVSSGLILGLAGVYAKELASAVSLRAALVSPGLLLTLAANVVGFVLMQAALQAGRGVVVVPIFSTLSNLVPIIGGVVVFHEWLPHHGPAAVLRPMAFVLALAGAALLAGFSERVSPLPAVLVHADEAGVKEVSAR